MCKIFSTPVWMILGAGVIIPGHEYLQDGSTTATRNSSQLFLNVNVPTINNLLLIMLGCHTSSV